MEEIVNRVTLEGKLCRVGPIKYSPSGNPVREIVVAVLQQGLDKESVGNWELVISGDLAHESASKSLRIGDLVRVEGSLWSRRYKSRAGAMVNEAKVMVGAIDKI